MAHEVELIRDGEGLAVIGHPTAVERFLGSVGLLSLAQELSLDKLQATLDTGSTLAEAAAYISENTGRYLKLTKESAGHVKELGLMPTKIKGVSHAMLGNPGSISKWIQIEDGPASLLANPAVLSGAAGIMAQLARQREAKEFKQLLLSIDSKLDDVLRKQRDAVLAKMYGVSDAIAEAKAIREHGGDSETLWGKVQSGFGAITEVQRNALLAIEALADKADDTANVKALTKATREIEAEVNLWLAVLARCFELHNDFADLELGHVLDTAPSSLDGHRLGIAAAMQKRRLRIVSTTTHLLTRLDKAGAVAQTNVVLHARAARTVVDSINTVGDSIEDFQVPFAVEAHREALTNTRWRDAVRDPQQLRNAAADVTPLAVGAVGTVAAVGAALNAMNKLGSSDGK
jgi:hypothetical protein